MNWKEYPYSAEYSEARGDIVHRPMIALKVKKGNESHNCLALIDSGTDSTMIDADFAKILGVDESQCRKVKVGSIEKTESQGFISRVKLSLEGFDDEFETEVIFVKNMVIGGLLGQDDIFERFKIRFEKKHKKFYMQKEV